ncbi:MAG: 2'-5' RNA ligase family protein [Acidimicrobiia bacterium]
MARGEDLLPEPAAPEPAKEITGIVIPVPEAQRYADHPHVTLLAPFRARNRLDEPALRASLDNFFAVIAPLRFALVQARRFPVGIHYLVPEPADPFRAMTLSLAARFPDCPPYGGQFDDVIPHLTIREDAGPLALPIEVHAAVAQLVHSCGSTWDLVAEFALAG